MIRSKRGLLLVALLTVIIGLLVMFPARLAVQWMLSPQLGINGTQGSIWRGTANSVTAAGVYVTDISWRIKPLHFFLGQAAFNVKGSPASGFVEGTVSKSITGTVTVSDLAASVPLHMFSQAFNIRGLQGDASLRFERIRLRDGLPIAADGTVKVDNLIAPNLSQDSIGGYQVEFFTKNDGVSAIVEDTDGVVDLAGSLQINDDRSYEFLGQLVAKPETPARMRKQMNYLGPANDRGQHELRIEGKL